MCWLAARLAAAFGQLNPRKPHAFLVYMNLLIHHHNVDILPGLIELILLQRLRRATCIIDSTLAPSALTRAAASGSLIVLESLALQDQETTQSMQILLLMIDLSSGAPPVAKCLVAPNDQGHPVQDQTRKHQSRLWNGIFQLQSARTQVPHVGDIFGQHPGSVSSVAMLQMQPQWVLETAPLTPV